MRSEYANCKSMPLKVEYAEAAVAGLLRTMRKSSLYKTIGHYNFRCNGNIVHEPRRQK